MQLRYRGTHYTQSTADEAIANSAQSTRKYRGVEVKSEPLSMPAEVPPAAILSYRGIAYIKSLEP